MSQRARIALVNMPFGSHYVPSIGLSLLKAALARHGESADILYLNLAFGERCEPALYHELSQGSPTRLAGEWVFAPALYGDAGDERGFIRDILDADAERAGAYLALRQEAAAFIDWCVDAHDWSGYRVVGFTSLFQQQIASLALARRIKERHPEVVIVFGGANCEVEMGQCLLDHFAFVDAVCSGEGDAVGPAFLLAVARGQPAPTLPGILTRAPDHGPRAGAPPGPVSMDELPAPDYDDYFRAFAAASFDKLVAPHVLFESARGCWWGAKSHCTFCGLNGSGMEFRAKSPERIVAELRELRDRYGAVTARFDAVDNILSMTYFDTVLPALAELEPPIELFYEVKANLKEWQVELLARAGVHDIQPGIESLSTSVLALMRKGATFLHNVRLLKWCRARGVRVGWNYLYGFPGEDPTEYERAAALIPLLTHLDPPDWWGSVRFDRFSPYMEYPDEFGVSNIRPYPAYRHIYPHLDDADRARIAYYFQADFPAADEVAVYTRALIERLGEWQRATAESFLFTVARQERLLVWDRRLGSTAPLHVLDGLARHVHELCDDIQGEAAIRKGVAARTGAEPAGDELDACLSSLVGRGLLVHENRRYLALATRADADQAQAWLRRALERT